MCSQKKDTQRSKIKQYHIKFLKTNQKSVIRKVIDSYKSITLFNQLGKPIVVVRLKYFFFAHVRWTIIFNDTVQKVTFV